MEAIKKKIQTLKDEVKNKGEEIMGIQDAINNAKERAKNAESDARKQENKLSEVEDDLDNVEDQIANFRKLLEVAEAERDDKEHELRKYVSTDGTTASTLKHQTDELKKAIDSAKEAQQKYEEASRKLLALEDELMETEENLELANAQNKEYDDLLHGASTDLKALQATKTKMAVMEEDCIEKVEVLEEEILRTEKRHKGFLENVKKLSLVKDESEAALEAATAEVQEITAEYDSLLSDLAEL